MLTWKGMWKLMMQLIEKMMGCMYVDVVGCMQTNQEDDVLYEEADDAQAMNSSSEDDPDDPDDLDNSPNDSNDDE